MRRIVSPFPTLCILAALALALPAAAIDEAAVDRAEFVFIGSVIETGVAGADVQAAPDIASVKVEEILRPEGKTPLSPYRGRTIAVKLIDPSAFSAGDRATFYTRVWLIGKGLSVVELASQAAPAAGTRATAESSARSALSASSDRQLAKRIEQASVILSGRVTAVREGDRASAARETERLSEHDPMWREAVILVEEGVKGVDAGTVEVTVRFSASTDILWMDSPKFEVGQEGVFLLGDEEVTGQSASSTRVGAPSATGSLVDPGNFLAKGELDRVRRLVR